MTLIKQLKHQWSDAWFENSWLATEVWQCRGNFWFWKDHTYGEILGLNLLVDSSFYSVQPDFNLYVHDVF